jgi:hypothetical protein
MAQARIGGEGTLARLRFPATCRQTEEVSARGDTAPANASDHNPRATTGQGDFDCLGPAYPGTVKR